MAAGQPTTIVTPAVGAGGRGTMEAILANEEEVPIEILPNGEVRAKGQTSSAELGGKKPLTMRENLGGEYGRE